MNLFSIFKRWFSTHPASELDRLIAENQRLAREQEAIREQRRVLRQQIDRTLKGE